MSSIDSRYLAQRETQAGKDFRAFRKLTKHIDGLSPIAKRHEYAALKTLKFSVGFGDMWVAVSWLLDNGTFPDRQRCLFPLGWLAAAPDRLRSVLHRAKAETARKHLDDWRRDLISEREREQARADRATGQAFEKFKAEYPSEPERRRAMIRIFNLHREKFGPITLTDPAARALCVALLVSELEALEVVQDRGRLAG